MKWNTIISTGEIEYDSHLSHASKVLVLPVEDNNVEIIFFLSYWNMYMIDTPSNFLKEISVDSLIIKWNLFSRISAS